MQKSFTAKQKLWTIMKIGFLQMMIAMALCGASVAHDNYGQVLDKKITLQLSDVDLENALQQIELASSVHFFYSIDQLDVTHKVSVNADGQTLREVLDNLFLPYQIRYKVHEREMTIILKKSRNLAASVLSSPKITIGSDMVKHKITGLVKDAKGQSLPGVNILIKGSTNGTTTDANGAYAIEAEDNDLLVFSFIGFTSLEMAVTGRAVIDVTLEEEISSLNEVVVNAGYWSVKEKEETGNISRITADEIQKQPVNNPLAAMIGRMPGVYVQQNSGVPGGAFTIQIRGQNSLRTDGNNPLYIIDGVPFTPTSLHTSLATSANGSSNPLNSINAADIASIEVLKDADATSVYGSRGSNGVVLITTKRGKAGKTKFDVNVYQGAGKVTRMMDLLNSKQYLQMRREALKNDNITPTAANSRDLVSWDTTRNTDWQKTLIGGTSHYTSAQASVSGGSATTQFVFGGGYYRETTVYPGSFSYQKASGHLNVNHQSENNKFRINLTSSFVTEDNNLLQTDLTSLTNSLAPVAPPIYQADGTLNWQNSSWNNPFAELRKKYNGVTENLITNAVISYEIIPGLNIKSNLGYNTFQLKENSIQPISSYNPALTITGNSRFGNSSDNKWLIEPQLDFYRQISRGKLSALAGSTFQSGTTQGTGIYGYNYTSDALLRNIAAAGDVIINSSTYAQYKYDAVFGRINYQWDSKYIVNITGRRDGSSRFGPGRQFANFGAVGAAWLFSNEKFMSDASIISYGKLRGSYGTTGSDQIPNYGYLSTYSPTAYPFNGVGGLIPTQIANKNYGWETNKKLEFGLELGLLKDRLYFTTSWYRNLSSNQLVGYTLPQFTGFASVQSNLPATVENKGLEFSLNSTILKGGGFAWNVSLNLTLPQNRLLSYPNIEASSYVNTYEVGKPLGIVKTYHFLGIDPQTGLDKFEDTDKDNAITFNDKQFLKKVAKSYYGGLQNSFSYKGIQLDVFFQFVKQTGRNYLQFFQTLPGSRFSNQPTIVLNRWRKPGDITNIEPFTTGNPAISTGFSNRIGSDQAISDASFIRLKNVSLSWQLPPDWIKRMKFQNAKIFAQGQNLLTFTKYMGRDPENLVATSLPPLRVISVGVQCSF